MGRQCEVGKHAIAKGEDDYRCYHCNRSVCKAHMGNPEGLPGDLIACVDHGEEVRQAEAKFKDLRQKNQVQQAEPTQVTRNTLSVEQSRNNGIIPTSARAYTSRMVERTVQLSEISPHPENPKIHSEGQIKQLKASHENLGQFEPVILWQRPKGYIQVKGHGYGEGTKQAGDTKTRAWILPEDTPESVVKQIMLASNLHGQNSHDDEDVLARLLKEQKDAGTDLTALGSDDESLRQLLAEVNREHATDFLDGVLKAPREDEEIGEDGEEGYGTMPLSGAESSSPQYFQVAYSLTAEQRTTVLDALKKAKQRYELQTSNQALVQICSEFLRGSEV